MANKTAAASSPAENGALGDRLDDAPYVSLDDREVQVEACMYDFVKYVRGFEARHFKRPTHGQAYNALRRKFTADIVQATSQVLIHQDLLDINGGPVQVSGRPTRKYSLTPSGHSWLERADKARQLGRRLDDVSPPAARAHDPAVAAALTTILSDPSHPLFKRTVSILSKSTEIAAYRFLEDNVDGVTKSIEVATYRFLEDNADRIVEAIVTAHGPQGAA